MTTTPKSPPAPHIAILGATGVVGRECLDILAQRRFPAASIRCLASARTAGERITVQGVDHTVAEFGPGALDGVDLILSAADAETSRLAGAEARRIGAAMIDKSSAFRADPAVPLVIPEVNPHALDALPPSPRPALRRAGIVAVPNCSTILLLIALEPLRAALGIVRVVVSTYQAASGAGAAAMRELAEQTRDVSAGRPAVPAVFREPCAFNVFSHDSAIDPSTGANAEEAKFTTETRRLWNTPDVRINATCVRVPVMRGHSESVCLTLKNPAAEEQIRSLLADAPAIQIIDDRKANTFPTPLIATGGDTVLVGRIRPDPTQPHDNGRYLGWNLWLSADQLRLGAALTAIKIAERLLAR